MKQLKKFLLMGSFALLLMLSPLSAYAAESTSNAAESTSSISDTIDIYPNPNVIASKVMTFDELVITNASDRNIPVEQAREELIANYIKAHSSDGLRSSIQPRTTLYQTFAVHLNAFSNYKPYIRWYCEVNEGGGYRGIVKILDTQLDRVDNGTAKQFSGTIYINLENANTIKYTINGDFFNYGTTTSSGNVGIKAGEFFTMSYTITSSSNYFGTIYEEGKFQLYQP